MIVNVITQDYYFFNGIKEGLCHQGWLIKMIDPHAFKNTPVSEFNENHILILHTQNYSNELSFLISINYLVKKVVVIPVRYNLKYNAHFKKYVLLEAHADINNVLCAITSTPEEDRYTQRPSDYNLTKREGTILLHVIHGMDAYTIGKELNISIKTVYTHRRNAYNKLGGRNLFEIVSRKEMISGGVNL